MEKKIMHWTDIRQAYPDQWLVIEALEAHTEDNKRRLDRIAVVDQPTDGQAAMHSYRRLHQQYPTREFYFVHTAPEQLEITERMWAGIRSGHATNLER
jgi:hypothetical protein